MKVKHTYKRLRVSCTATQQTKSPPGPIQNTDYRYRLQMHISNQHLVSPHTQHEKETHPEPFNALFQPRAGVVPEVLDVEAEVERLQKRSREDQIRIVRGKLCVRGWNWGVSRLFIGHT